MCIRYHNEKERDYFKNQQCKILCLINGYEPAPPTPDDQDLDPETDETDSMNNLALSLAGLAVFFGLMIV